MPEPVKIPVSMPLSTPEPMLLKMPAPIRKRLIVSGNVQQTGYRVLVKSIARSMGIVGFVRNQPDETVEVVCEGETKKIDQFIKLIDRKGDPLSPTDIDVYSIVETTPIDVGSYSKFDIEYNGKRTLEEKERDNQDRMESMILGASLLKQEVRGVGKAVEGVGQKVDGVGKAVEGVGQKVDGVGKAVEGVGQKVDGVGKAVEGVGQKVDCLGQKMDGVGKAVEGVGQKVDCLGQKMDGVGKDVRNMHVDMNKRFDHMAQRYDLIALSLVKAIDRMDRNSKITDKAIEQSRKEAAASNRELAKAVNFMIKKLSGKPASSRRGKTRK